MLAGINRFPSAPIARHTAVEPPDSKQSALRGFTAGSASHQETITLRNRIFEIVAGAGWISFLAFFPLLLKNSSSAVQVFGSTTVHLQRLKLATSLQFLAQRVMPTLARR